MRIQQDGRHTQPRVTDEVRVDPPPQAHTGVRHDPEWTTAVPAGHGDRPQPVAHESSTRTAPAGQRLDPATALASAASSAAVALAAAPPSAVSAAAYRSAGRTPPCAETR